MKACFSCGKALDVNDKPGRKEECPSCGADVRVCLNCRFYDAGAYNECRESSADRVVDKEKANFCDYFVPGNSSGQSEDNKGKAKKDLDDLFGGL
ncbi:MAG: hypothetical protein OEV42_11295 [Deltaproteobacteria bacterium]|nr:hypothetical protein [Deltaproteobacteria bacterium]